MATFKVRVEDRIGDVGDDAALSDWLTAGGRYITNLLPPQRIEKFTTTLTDSGSGVSITTSRVLSAHKAGYNAVLVPSGLAAQIADSASIHYAGTTDPVFYILNGLALVKPGGGSVIAMAYPTVAYGDSTISAFPADLDEGVVLYASIQGRIRQLSNLALTTIGGLSFVTPVIPSPPASPSFTYTPGTYTDAHYDPAIYIKALIDTIGTTTISFSDTLSFAPPVFTGSYTNTDTALTNQDIELANGHLGKVSTQLNEMQSNLSVAVADFNKDKTVFDANLQIAINNAQLAQQRLMQQSQLQIELNKFNEAQEVQTALANANQEAQLDAQNKAKAMELAIINATKEFERQLQEFQAKLSLYGQEMNGYSTSVQAEATRISALIGQYNTEAQLLSLGLQSLRNEFNEFLKAI